MGRAIRADGRRRLISQARFQAGDALLDQLALVELGDAAQSEAACTQRVVIDLASDPGAVGGAHLAPDRLQIGQSDFPALSEGFNRLQSRLAAADNPRCDARNPMMRLPTVATGAARAGQAVRRGGNAPFFRAWQMFDG
jgi:hypothetical protein